MATAKKAAPKAAAKKSTVKSKAARATPKAAVKTSPKGAGVLKPIKEAFNKTSLVNHLVQASGADAKTVKAVLGSLEATIHASLSKKGAGAFTWPGVVKITATESGDQKRPQGYRPIHQGRAHVCGQAGIGEGQGALL